MAILSSLEELTKSLSNLIGERTDDEAIEVLENFTDTFTDLYSRTEDSRKSDDIEKEWREKYRNRFYNGENSTPQKPIEEQRKDVEKDGESVSFDDLFEEREG